MCAGPELVAAASLAATAIGTGATIYNTQNTLHRQDQENAASIRRQSQLQQQANQQVGQTVQKITASDPTDARQASLDQYLQQLHGSQPTNQAAMGGGGVSSAFDALSGANLKASDDRAAGQASLLARIDAPTTQRRAEGVEAADLSTFLGQLAGDSSAEGYLNTLRLHGINRNPWIDLAADAAKTAGSTYAAYGGGTASNGAGGGAVSATGTSDTGFSSGQPFAYTANGYSKPSDYYHGWKY